jgi:hypothetical protein
VGTAQSFSASEGIHPIERGHVMRNLVLLITAMAIVVGCGPVPSGQPGTPTPSVAAPNPSSAANAKADLVMAGPIGVMLPAGWQQRTTLPNPSGNWTLLFAGPGDLPSECQAAANGDTTCSSWPITHLAPGGIIVAVRAFGQPGFQPPTGGDPVSVSGLSARRITGTADGSCRSIDGTQLVEVWLPALVGTNGFYSIDACTAGADDAAANAFAAVLASIVVTAGAQPS